MEAVEIRFGQQVPVNTETFVPAIMSDVHDGKNRTFYSLKGQLEGNRARVLASLLPLDQAFDDFPARTLKRNLPQEEVKEMIARQRANQGEEFLFPVINLVDVKRLAGSRGNRIGCVLQEDGETVAKAAFTYKRCPLFLVADFWEDKLLASFWRQRGAFPALDNHGAWKDVKRTHTGETDYRFPILPAKLLVLTQDDLAAGNLTLKFSRLILPR